MPAKMLVGSVGAFICRLGLPIAARCLRPVESFRKIMYALTSHESNRRGHRDVSLLLFGSDDVHPVPAAGPRPGRVGRTNDADPGGRPQAPGLDSRRARIDQPGNLDVRGARSGGT